MNINNTKDVPTRLASPYSAKYRHRRPLSLAKDESSKLLEPILLRFWRTWSGKLPASAVPNWVTLVAIQSVSFGQELSAQSQENDKYLAYIAWLAQSTYSHGTAYIVYTILPIKKKNRSRWKRRSKGRNSVERERVLTRAWQIIPFFLPIILFDYSQTISPLFSCTMPIIPIYYTYSYVKK